MKFPERHKAISDEYLREKAAKTSDMDDENPPIPFPQCGCNVMPPTLTPLD